MSKLWVKLGGNSTVKVSTEGCADVDDFIEATKKKLTHKLGEYDSDQISISLTEGGKALRRGLKLNEVPNITENNDENPLFINATRTISPTTLNAMVEMIKNTTNLQISDEVRKLITTHKDFSAELMSAQSMDKSQMRKFLNKAKIYIKTKTRVHLAEKYHYEHFEVLTHAGQDENIIYKVIDSQHGIVCAKRGKIGSIKREKACCDKVVGPCVMPCIEFIEDGELGMIIVPLYGCTVRDLINSDEALSEQQVAMILLCGLSGIYSFASKGMHHCDIKPSNIALAPGRIFVLIDFGSATDSGAFLRSFTPKMSISRASPSIGFDVACLATTIMQVMFQNCDTYVTKEHLLQQCGLIQSRFPTVCTMLKLLPIDEEIQIDSFIETCKNLFEISRSINGIDEKVLQKVNIIQ